MHGFSLILLPGLEKSLNSSRSGGLDYTCPDAWCGDDVTCLDSGILAGVAAANIATATSPAAVRQLTTN